MRTTQRERRYVCGMNKQEAKYQEVEIYTVSTDKAGREREKEKSTPPPLWGKKPEKWDGHNAARARKWFARVLATNFTEQDIHMTTTYNPEMLPDNDTQADRDITNLLRHLREKCRKQGLPDPQAIIVTENQEANPETGQKAVRYHHHIVLRCALTRDEIEACWHRKGKRLGLANADRLQMDKHHLNALAGYLMKYPKRRHRWRRTKGIQDPILPKPNDSKYTRRGIERIAKDPAKLNDPKFWAKKYPGWELVEATADYNDYWGWSIMLKMHKVQERGRGRPRGDQA